MRKVAERIRAAPAAGAQSAATVAAATTALADLSPRTWRARLPGTGDFERVVAALQETQHASDAPLYARRPRVIAERRQFPPCAAKLVFSQIGTEVRSDVVSTIELRQYVDELKQRIAQRRIAQHLPQNAAATPLSKPPIVASAPRIQLVKSCSTPSGDALT